MTSQSRAAAPQDPSARGLLAAVRRDLDALVTRAARNFRTAQQVGALFAQLDPDLSEESWKRWERLGLRLLILDRAVARLGDAPALDLELLRLRGEEVEAIRATWRAYDQQWLAQVTNDEHLTAEERAATIADTDANAAERETLFAAIKANLHELAQLSTTEPKTPPAVRRR